MNCRLISFIIVLLSVTFSGIFSMQSNLVATHLSKEARNRQAILDAELPAKIHKKLLGWCRYAQFCRHQHPVVSVCCSLDGRYLFSGTSNGQAQMWDRPSRVSRDEKSILGIEGSSFHSFNALCCSPDGRY